MGIFLEKAPCDKYPLALTSRKHGTQISDMRLVAILHLYDFVMNLAPFADIYDLIHGRVWVDVLQIEQDRVIKQQTVLGNDSDIFPEALET